jgi:hypothetical protein
VFDKHIVEEKIKISQLIVVLGSSLRVASIPFSVMIDIGGQQVQKTHREA